MSRSLAVLAIALGDLFATATPGDAQRAPADAALCLDRSPGRAIKSIEDACARAIRADGGRENWSYHHRLGEIAQARKDFPAAAAHFTRAITANPDRPDAYTAYVNRGLARKGAGDSTGAIEDPEKSIALSPNVALAHVQLGYLLLAGRHHAEAVRSINETLRIDERDAEACRGLITGFAESGQYDQAVQALEAALARADFEAVLRLQPNLPEGRLRLGQTRIKTENFAEAIVDCNQAMLAQPLGSPA